MEEDGRGKGSGFKKANYEWQVKRSRSHDAESADDTEHPQDVEMVAESENQTGAQSTSGSADEQQATPAAQFQAEVDEPQGVKKRKADKETTDKEVIHRRKKLRTVTVSAEIGHDRKMLYYAKVQLPRTGKRPKHGEAGDAESSSDNCDEDEEDDDGDEDNPARHMDRWQSQHIASAMVDNAINCTLEEIHGGAIGSGNSRYTQRRNRLVSEGVDVAIQEQGLRSQPAPQGLDTPSAAAGSGTTAQQPDDHGGPVILQFSSGYKSKRHFQEHEEGKDESKPSASASVSSPDPTAATSSQSQGAAKHKIGVHMLREALGIAQSRSDTGSDQASNVTAGECSSSADMAVTESCVSEKNNTSLVQEVGISPPEPITDDDSKDKEADPSVLMDDEHDDAQHSFTTAPCDMSDHGGAISQHNNCKFPTTPYGITSPVVPGEKSLDSNHSTVVDHLRTDEPAQRPSAAALPNLVHNIDAIDSSHSDDLDIDMIPTHVVPSTNFILDQAVNAAILEKGLQL